MNREGHAAAQFQVQVISGSIAMQQYSDLLDRCYDLPPEMHFLDDFPVWDHRYQPTELQRLGVFFSSKDLISTAAVRIAYVKTSQAGRLKIGILGGVATDPRWRKKGLASKTVTEAMNWAKTQGAAAVFLWGSEHELYRKLGFVLCGQQVRVPFQLLKKKSINILINDGWHRGIFSLISKRKGGLVLKNSDLSWYEAHKNVSWLYSGSIDQPDAYVAYGRGIDLGGMVHEWGGFSDHLSQIFQEIMMRDPNAVLLSSPEQLDQLQELGFSFSQLPVEPLCLAKVLNPTKIVQSYFPGVELRDFSIDHLNEQELTLEFFGPGSSNCHLKRGRFPLPLWFWGLDAA